MSRTLALEDFVIDLEIELESAPEATRVTARFDESRSVDTSDRVPKNR